MAIVLMTIFCQASLAQDQSNPTEKKRALSLTVGYVEKLDQFNGASSGVHLGANLFKPKARRWSYDAQLAVNITGGSSTYFTPTLLGGGRYYFTSGEKPTRLFMNMLAGLALEVDFGDDFTEVLPDIGYSVGLYLQSRKFLYGVAVESPENLVFKVGVTL